MLFKIGYPQYKIDFLLNKNLNELFQFLKNLHINRSRQFFKESKFGGILTANEIGDLLVKKLNSGADDSLNINVYAYILNLFDDLISLRFFARFKKRIRSEFY